VSLCKTGRRSNSPVQARPKNLLRFVTEAVCVVSSVQMTFPLASLRMYLYWNEPLAEMGTDTDQFGYVVASVLSITAALLSQLPSSGMEPTTYSSWPQTVVCWVVKATLPVDGVEVDVGEVVGMSVVGSAGAVVVDTGAGVELDEGTGSAVDVLAGMGSAVEVDSGTGSVVEVETGTGSVVEVDSGAGADVDVGTGAGVELGTGVGAPVAPVLPESSPTKALKS